MTTFSENIRKIMGWCPNGNVIKSIPSIRFQNTAIENVSGTAPNEKTALWLSRLFGALNLPVAFIAIIDIIGAFFITPPHIPRTLEHGLAFLTAISAIAGVTAGFTARSHHSIKRKLMHILIAALGVVMISIALIRQW
jgi:hypothetical protein